MCCLEPEVASQFDEKIRDLLKKLEEAYRSLNDRVAQVTPEQIDTFLKFPNPPHLRFVNALHHLNLNGHIQ